MPVDDLRAMTDEELATELDESQRAAMNLRFRAATMQLANVAEIRSVRKRMARIHTIMRERQLARAPR
jgi:large subunit ribosomal protein L29